MNELWNSDSFLLKKENERERKKETEKEKEKGTRSLNKEKQKKKKQNQIRTEKGRKQVKMKNSGKFIPIFKKMSKLLVFQILKTRNEFRSSFSDNKCSLLETTPIPVFQKV